MANPEKVHGLIQNLEKELDQLQIIVRMMPEELFTDPLALGAAKYYLQTALESSG